MGGSGRAVNGLSAALGPADAAGALRLGLGPLAAVAVAGGRVLTLFADVAGHVEFAIAVSLKIGRPSPC